MIIETIDYHTAGEPFRIVTGGLPAVPGDTVAERRAHALGPGGGPLDGVRQLLTREPRGHAGMYGGFLVPPDDRGAQLGVLFFHQDGYSTACGHGTIALGAWAVESGLVAAPEDGGVPVRIDVPSGRVTALVHRAGGRTTAVGFRSVPATVLARGVPVATALGTVRVDVADAGARYASLAVPEVSPAALPELAALGRAIRAVLVAEYDLYGVVLYQELPDTPAGPHQRGVTVFADGQLDRSPCGSGTAARLALLTADGRIAAGQELRHESVVGTVFTGRLLGESPRGLLTEVTGQAYRTGEHRFVLDPDDPLGTGFRFGPASPGLGGGAVG
ncbi:proline racemase family protein [Kitasatospora sp. NPDC052896]|uniref:proline racemase family protein n=1 Tax=Kitasatospora sp. NPDC052896 TaxID=3364061 RepID=UPI0037C53A58